MYLGGLFQRFSPLHLAVVAFTLCTVVFLPIALYRHPGSARLLARFPCEVLAINATSGLAWLGFF